MKSSTFAKLEWGKGQQTNFHTKDEGGELEQAFRDQKIHMHRYKDKKKGEGEYWWMHKTLLEATST